jgi:hypothetical protein
MTHRLKEILPIVMIVLTAMLVPVVVYTYSLLSPARHWPSMPVEICVHSPGHVSIADSDKGVTAVIQALNGNHPLLAGTGWNVTDVGTMVDAVPCGGTWALGDGIPSIAFDEKIKGTCTGSCLAATFVGYYHCDPALSDGHCVVDDADVETRRNKADRSGGPYYSLNEPCTPGKEWNIEGIMIHETGHQLGIGHSGVSGATMYPSVYSCNSAPATIASDDAAALDALYPPP